MMRNFNKRDFPVAKARRFLEPVPIVLISSAYKGETNIMTLGWQTIMEFQPSLVGCMITAANHSYELISKSKECVINLPTADLIEKIVGIGNTTGAEIDKFAEFELTATPSVKVEAPSIKECYANFECKLYDGKLLREYNFFIFEIVKAKVAVSPKYPKTVHYRGDGIFMLSGDYVNLKKQFRPDNL